MGRGVRQGPTPPPCVGSFLVQLQNCGGVRGDAAQLLKLRLEPVPHVDRGDAHVEDQLQRIRPQRENALRRAALHAEDHPVAAVGNVLLDSEVRQGLQPRGLLLQGLVELGHVRPCIAQRRQVRWDGGHVWVEHQELLPPLHRVRARLRREVRLDGDQVVVDR